MATAEVTPMNDTAKSAASISLELSQLQHAIGKIAPAIPGGAISNQAMRSIRFEKIGGYLGVSASDTNLSMRAILPVSSELSQPVLVSSERFQAWVKLLNGKEVSVSYGGSRARVRCGKSATQIPTFNHAPFLDINAPKENSLSIPQGIALRLLTFGGHAINEEETRIPPVCALIHDGHSLDAISSDGHRVARYSVPCSGEPFGQVELTERMVKALLRTLEADDSSSVVFSDDGHAVHITISQEIPIMAACAKFAKPLPNMKRFIPEQQSILFTISAEELVSAVERCLIIGDQKTRAVYFSFDENQVTLRSMSELTGESDEVIDFTDPSGSIAKQKLMINGQYVVDGLKHVKGDVRVGMTSPKLPITFECSPHEGEKYTYIVVPMFK